MTSIRWQWEQGMHWAAVLRHTRHCLDHPRDKQARARLVAHVNAMVPSPHHTSYNGLKWYEDAQRAINYAR